MILLKAFRILGVPLLELIVLRVWFHQVAHLRLGFPGFTDYELLLPVPLGFLAFLWAIDREGGISWKFSLRKLYVHLLFLMAFLGLSFLLKSHGHLIGLWWVTLFCLIVSGASIPINVTHFIKSRSIWAVIPSMLMAFSLVIYFKWGGTLFQETISLWAYSMETFFSSLGFKEVKVYSMITVVQIYHPRWTAHIGRGCAGFDSFIFFSGAFCVFAPTFWRQFKRSQWCIFFLMGVLLFYILNFLRIVLLFSVGITLMYFIPSKEAIKIALNLFHAHLGYSLYALGLFGYFKWILNRRRSSSFVATKQLPAQMLPLPPPTK